MITLLSPVFGGSRRARCRTSLYNDGTPVTVRNPSDADHARSRTCQNKGQEYPPLLCAVSPLSTGELITCAMPVLLGRPGRSETAGSLGSLHSRWRHLRENDEHAGVLKVNDQQFHHRKQASRTVTTLHESHLVLPLGPQEPPPDLKGAHFGSQYWLHCYY